MSRRLALLVFVLALFLDACQSAGTSPRPVPSGTGSAPVGTNLIWLYGDPNPMVHPLIDWSGKPQGTLRLEGSILPSPDGQRALVNATQVIDARGEGLGGLALPGLDIRDVMWADDSQHLCLIAEPLAASPENGARSLWIAEPGESPRRVGAVGAAGSLAGVTACSIINNRAVVISDYGAHIPPPQGNKVLLTAQVQVIALSSGSVLYQHDYLSGPNAVLAVSSGDGRYLVENGVLTNVASIRDLSDGQVLAALPAGVDVMGLSWDGARLFETSPSGSQQAVAIVDRASGQLIWRQVGDGFNFLWRLHTADLLVSTLRANAGSSLTLIPASGPAVTLPSGGSFVSSCPCLGAGGGA